MNFAAFALDDQRQVEEFSRSISYPPGIQLFQEGDDAEEVFYLDQGLVKLLRVGAGGDQLIVALRSAGWFLASAACVLERPYAVTAMTVTACRLSRVPGDTFRRLLMSNPTFSWRIHRMNSIENHAQVSQVLDMHTMPALQRVESFLKNIACGRAAITGQHAVRCEVPLRQWEIAQLIGITPPYLSQLLGELEEAGVVVRDRQGRGLIYVVCAEPGKER